MLRMQIDPNKSFKWHWNIFIESRYCILSNNIPNHVFYFTLSFYNIKSSLQNINIMPGSKWGDILDRSPHSV